MDKLHVAVVCSCNMNRSMHAHGFLAERGFHVKSYGTADKIRLPSLSPFHINCYEFGVSYDFIIKDLERKGDSFYTSSGILKLLNRNKRIKPHPQKFQNSNEKFDIIITCETLVYEEVLEWFERRAPSGTTEHPVYVVNINIKDNYKDALIGAVWISNLLTLMTESDNLDKDAFNIIDKFQAKVKQMLLRSKQYY